MRYCFQKPTVEELPPDEQERQRVEDERYLAEKRQQALDRLETQNETVTSQVVMVSESKKDKGGKEDRKESRKGKDDRTDRRDSKR